MTQYVGVLSGDNTSTSYQMDSIIKLQYFLIKMKKKITLNNKLEYFF
jgi:hypothetical protein